MKVQISNVGLWMILVAMVVPFGHFVYVSFVIGSAGRDGWISLLLSGLAGLFVVLVLFRPVANGGELSLVSLVEGGVGKWIGKLLLLVYALYFLLVVAIVLHVMDMFMGMLYNRTPILVFSGMTDVLVIWVVVKGVEVMTRAIQLLLPVLVFGGLTLTVLTLKDKDITNLLPILDHGWAPVFHGALVLAAVFCEFVVLLTLTPYVTNRERLWKQGIWAVGVIAAMFVGVVTGPILVFTEPVAQSLALPTYAEISYIEYPNVLERMDIIGILLWAVGSYFRASVFCFAAHQTLMEIVGRKRPRILAVVAGLLALGGAMLMDIYSSREQTFAVLNGSYLTVVIGLGGILPLLLLGLRAIRRRIPGWGPSGGRRTKKAAQ